MAGYEELMGADTWEMVRANVQLRERKGGGGGTTLQRSMRTAPLHDKKCSNFSMRRTRAFVEATLSKVCVNTAPLLSHMKRRLLHTQRHGTTCLIVAPPRSHPDLKKPDPAALSWSAGSGRCTSNPPATLELSQGY